MSVAQTAITVITTSDVDGRPHGFLTKRVTPAGIKGFKFPYLITSRPVETGSIHELARLLDSLADQPHSCLMRGRKLQGKEAVHHRVADANKEECAYEAAACQWLCLDVDDLSYLQLGCDPNTLPPVLPRRIVQKYLPSAFHNVTYYWQLSSSHGYDNEKAATVSIHLWFWLDRPCTNDEVKRYIQFLNHCARIEHRHEGKVFDTSTWNTVQPLFTADPVLEGVEPLPYKRRGLDVFDSHVVPLSVRLDNAPGAWLRYLERVGDDKDGFHDPILAAVASHIREFGKPSPATREAIKAAVRQAVDLANPGSRSADVIARYKRDEDFLDPAIDGAVGKGFGQAGTDEIAEAAGLEFVWCRRTSDYWHKERRYSCHGDGVRTAFRASKDITRSSFFQQQLQHVDMVRAVPGQPPAVIRDRGVEIWNSWRGRLLEPTYGSAGWFEAHVAYLCDDDPVITSAVLDWFAHLLANPGRKLMWALVIGSSRDGVGKSLLGQLMGNLVEGTHFLTENDITEKYKDFMIDAELAVCEEIRIDPTLNATDALKVYITEPRVQVRRFARPHEKIVNYCNFLMNTNHRDALPLRQEGERRYLVVFTDREPQEAAYYTRLAAHVREDAADVLGWALNRDLSRFNPYAPPPQTEHARRMSDLARPPDEQVVVEAIRERADPFHFQAAFSMDVLQRLRTRLRVRTTPQQLRRLIERHGGEYLPRVHGKTEHGNTTKSLFVLDAEERKLGGLKEVDLFKLAVEHQRKTEPLPPY